MKRNNKHWISLVVNADDFGFFPCVSRGIIECARQGVITATGIMANGPYFEKLVNWLHDFAQIDIGVHLNITYGKPVSTEFLSYLKKIGGVYPGKSKIALMLLRKQLPLNVVMEEWHAQINRCLSAGLKVSFLNTHEHIHLLPPLAGPILDIARYYGIENVRHPAPEWKIRPLTGAAFLRNCLMHFATLPKRTSDFNSQIRVIGISVSGRLTLQYLDKCFCMLEPGKTYELMCHPGYYNPEEIRDINLVRFHAWQEELELLTSKAFKTLIHKHGIRLSHFRHRKKTCPLKKQTRSPERKT